MHTAGWKAMVVLCLYQARQACAGDVFLLYYDSGRGLGTLLGQVSSFNRLKETRFLV
jgi:hypothetical protein